MDAEVTTNLDGLTINGSCANTQENAEDDGDIVDPWNVTSKSDTGIDYDKLISK